MATKYAGAHEVTLYGPDNSKSPVLTLHMPENQIANELMDIVRPNTILMNSQLEIFKAKGFNSNEVLETATAAQKTALAFELNNSSKVIKQGIGDPSILYADDSSINVYCDVPVQTRTRTASKQYYLCLLPASRVGYSDLKEKILITNNDFNCTLYKSKHALLNGDRYCIWIEDETGKIISRTTGFDFNLESTQIALFKSCEIVADTKPTFDLKQNQIKAEDFKSDPLLSESKLYDSIIVDNIVDIDPSDVKQLEYIHDSIKAKHKRNNVSISKSSIPGLSMNVALKFISGDFKSQGYTKAYIRQYDSQGNSVLRVYNILNDYIQIPDVDHLKYKCSSIYFSDDASLKVSEMIVLGFPRKEYISDMKVEVKW